MLPILCIVLVREYGTPSYLHNVIYEFVSLYGQKQCQTRDWTSQSPNKDSVEMVPTLLIIQICPQLTFALPKDQDPIGFRQLLAIFLEILPRRPSKTVKKIIFQLNYSCSFEVGSYCLTASGRMIKPNYLNHPVLHFIF